MHKKHRVVVVLTIVFVGASRVAPRIFFREYIVMRFLGPTSRILHVCMYVCGLVAETETGVKLV